MSNFEIADYTPLIERTISRYDPALRPDIGWPAPNFSDRETYRLLVGLANNFHAEEFPSFEDVNETTFMRFARGEIGRSEVDAEGARIGGLVNTSALMLVGFQAHEYRLLVAKFEETPIGYLKILLENNPVGDSSVAGNESHEAWTTLINEGVVDYKLYGLEMAEVAKEVADLPFRVVGDVRVHPAHRSRGVASALYRHHFESDLALVSGTLQSAAALKARMNGMNDYVHVLPVLADRSRSTRLKDISDKQVLGGLMCMLAEFEWHHDRWEHYKDLDGAESQRDHFGFFADFANARWKAWPDKSGYDAFRSVNYKIATKMRESGDMTSLEARAFYGHIQDKTVPVVSMPKNWLA